jgi:DNA-binding MarR family transcriptional regulator
VFPETGIGLAAAMIEPRTEAALRAIRRLLRAAEIGERQLATATGLTPSQLVVLQEVSRHGETTAGRIASAVQFSHATVTNLVDRLVERDFVRRQKREQDRRQVWVSITAEGTKALSSAPDTMQDRFRSRFESTPDWEQAMVVAMLERLTSLLNADHIDAAPVIDAGPIDRAGPI